MLFSIITPTWQRLDGRLERCLTSIRNQSHRQWGQREHIVVDDGSSDGTWAYLRAQGVYGIQQNHGGRVVARNRGMEAATGDWICWLDSDDAYDVEYLTTLDYHIQQHPEARLFVMGSVYHGMVKDEGQHICPAWTQIRPAWAPPLIDEGLGFPIHQHFPSGKVGTGMFVFHRSCLDKIGLMPNWKTVDEVADGVDGWLGYETGYGSTKKHVGNPWGEDWAQFRKLTMYYQVHLIKPALYNQYVR